MPQPTRDPVENAAERVERPLALGQHALVEPELLWYVRHVSPRRLVGADRTGSRAAHVPAGSPSALPSVATLGGAWRRAATPICLGWPNKETLMHRADAPCQPAAACRHGWRGSMRAYLSNPYQRPADPRTFWGGCCRETAIGWRGGAPSEDSARPPVNCGSRSDACPTRCHRRRRWRTLATTVALTLGSLAMPAAALADGQLDPAFNGTGYHVGTVGRGHRLRQRGQPHSDDRAGRRQHRARRLARRRHDARRATTPDGTVDTHVRRRRLRARHSSPARRQRRRATAAPRP